MKAALPLLLFGAACVAQWAVPLVSIRLHEEVIEKGARIRIAVTAPDPYDPLRGRYLLLQPVEFEVALDSAMNQPAGGRKVWGQLKMGSDGLHHLEKITEQRPNHGDYVQLTLRPERLRGRATEGRSSKTKVEWPFDRFFVNEKVAPKADAWLRENSRGNKWVVAEARVLNGEVVLTDLELDGISFREVFMKNEK